MQFKEFLHDNQLHEAENMFLSWDARSPGGWQKSEVGYRPTIQVYIDNKRVSVDHAGPRHPLMKRALKQLIKQYPDVVNKKLDFDGYSPGSLKDYLNTSDLHGPKDVLPKYLYTGTSLFRWESIREEGLKPRSETGADPVFGADKTNAPLSHPDRVYLSGSFGSTTRFAASDASRDTSIPVVLRIDTAGLNYNNLKPDEDSKAANWKDSLYTLDTIAYEGVIPPRYIQLYKARNPKTGNWENPGNWIEPQDWLAQQVLHPTTKIRWVNPREKNEAHELDSREFGDYARKRMSRQNIEVDGHIEVDFRESELDHDTQKVMLHYQIKNIDNKIVKSGAFNYYNLTYSSVYYIVYEFAKRLGIYKPSNLILTDGNLTSVGIAQPKLDMNAVKKDWNKINKILNAW